MNVRLFMGVNAAVGAVTGLVMLFAPATLLGMLGLPDSASVQAMAHVYGAELIGFNVATGLAAGRPSWQRPIILGHAANEPLTAVVVALAALSGTGNAMSWGLVAIAGAFGLGYLWLAAQGKTSEQGDR